MDLATLDIDRDEAEARLAEYQEALAIERTAQDEAIAMGYRAAARGMPIIRLSQTIKNGGLFDNQMPKIAVVRADAREVYCRWQDGNLVFADYDDWRANRGALVGVHTVRVPMEEPRRSTVGNLLGLPSRPAYWTAASTIVPLIPPRHRPKRRRIHRYHLLWEVESWTRQPPKDPALIKHIRGDLWAVLAVWDLTDLERAVLAM